MLRPNQGFTYNKFEKPNDWPKIDKTFDYKIHMCSLQKIWKTDKYNEMICMVTVLRKSSLPVCHIPSQLFLSLHDLFCLL